MTALLAGLAVGSLYALIALGFNLTYVAAGVLNFAHPNLIILGAFIATALGGTGVLDWFVAIVVAAVVVGLVGVLEERVAIRPIAGGNSHAELVTTVGVATVLTGVMLLQWGPEARRVESPLPNQSFNLAGGSFQAIDALLLSLAILLAVGLHLGMHKTRFGLASLAQSEDRQAAELLGINVRRLSVVGFALAAALAGVLGPIIGVKTFALATIPVVLAVKGFVAYTVGGVGSNAGALLGGLGVGVAESMAGRYLGADFQLLAVFALFLIIIMLRPQGLLGTARMRAV